MTDPTVAAPDAGMWNTLADKAPIALIVVVIIWMMLRFLEKNNMTWKEVVLSILKRGKED